MVPRGLWSDGPEGEEEGEEVPPSLPEVAFLCSALSVEVSLVTSRSQQHTERTRRKKNVSMINDFLIYADLSFLLSLTC